MGHVDMKIQFLFLSKTLMEGFINWFQSHEARLDTSALGITVFSPSEGGRGAIALMDIPVCGRFVLFLLMDQLYLNTGGTCVVLDTEKSHTFYAYISATSAVWL